MAILKKAAVEAFIRAPSPETKAVLVYGADAGRVHEAAAAIVRSAAGSLDDPFTVVQVSDTSLAADPALLADEARSLSLGGGRRVVWVAPAGRGFQSAIESYLADPGGDGLIVAEAAALQKSSKLRTLLEKSKEAAVIACYEDSAEDLRDLVRRAAAEAKLAVVDAVLEHIVDRIGSDRSLSRREIEKLVLYCYGRESIELDDVEAACGDVSTASLDALLDATFGGDTAECCRRLAQLEESGMSGSGVLTNTGAHVARLQEFRNDIDRGKARDSVLGGARPPIHFSRQPSLARQLAVWPGSALDEALSTVLEATALTRQFASLEHAITERAILSLARRAQALRRRAA
jgi:DNA polymerase III subunit delta